MTAFTGTAFTGTATLARLIVRRDRVLLGLWVAVLGLLPVGVGAAGSDAAYPTAADRARFAASVVDPATVALRGPVLAPTTGGLTAWTVGASGTILAAVVAVLLVVRHTRVEEQAGRADLLGASVLGRYAATAAALGVVAAGFAGVALVVTGTLVAYGLPLSGSAALGAMFLATGVLFAAVAAVTAQVASDASTARGLAFVALGALFLLAAAGQVGRPALQWATPFGWARRLAPFAGDRWWVLLPFAAATAGMLALTVLLARGRDIGAGLLAPRPGPATGTLGSPLALAWRLHRGWVAAWASGGLVAGAVIGAVAASAAPLLATPGLRAVFGDGDPATAFLRTVLYVLAQVTTAAVVAGALRLRREESSGLADVLLALPVGRPRWAGGHLLATTAGAAAVLVALGVGAGATSGRLLPTVATTVAYLPACVTFAGLAIALAGWLPRAAAPVTWAALAATVALDFLAEFRLAGPGVTLLSPFARTADGLASGIVAPFLALTAVAAALAVIGAVGLRRRDMAPL